MTTMIRAKLPLAVQRHLATIADDGADLFLLENDTIHGRILNATRLVNQMRANHVLGILETTALGYAYMAALLIGFSQKGQDRLSIELSCDGVLRGFSVEAVATGTVRGYLYEPNIPIDAELDSFDLSPFIGSGSLTLRRFAQGAVEPVSGTTMLRYGNLAQDLTNHFRESEQTQTAISLSIFFDQKGLPAGAGGIFLQALPGADPVVLDDLDQWLPSLPSLSQAIAQNDTATHYLHSHFAAFQPRIIGSRPAEFWCACNRQKFGRYLRSLPKTQLIDLIKAGPMPMKLICHNCGVAYAFGKADLLD